MRCTCFASTGALASIASVTIRKLLSGSSGGTCRSSPKKNWVLPQGTIACRTGLFISSPYSTFGVEPPESATQKLPFLRTASFAASRNSAAAVCAMALESTKTLISRLVVTVSVVIVSVHPRSRSPYRRRNLTRLRHRMIFPDRSPSTAIAREQFVRFCRPPASGRIVRKALGRSVGPRIQNGLNHSPARLHHVRTLEQRGVPHHTVVHETFVPGAMRTPEVARVVKLHIHEAELHHRAWNLGSKSQ